MVCIDPSKVYPILLKIMIKNSFIILRRYNLIKKLKKVLQTYRVATTFNCFHYDPIKKYYFLIIFSLEIRPATVSHLIKN